MTRLNGPIVVGVTNVPHAAAGVADAIAVGAWEAARHHVELNLVCGSELPPSWTHADARAAERGSLSRALDRIVARTASTYPSLAVSGALHAGSAARILVEASATASLVVVCADARVHYGGLQAGLVSTQVAAHAHGPVIIVPPPRDRPPTAERALVVVGIDGSPGSADAIAFGFAEAHARDGRLQGVYAWEPSASRRAGEHDAGPTTTADDMLLDATSEWRRKYPDVPVDLAAVDATNPVRALNDAGADADLIVVGSRGGGGFGTLRLGSVSDGLVRYSRAMVAVIPADR
jgi:nucleotide-binding universal stress UspA family protein